MNKSALGPFQVVVLECGCTIKDVSGELSQECLPHKQCNFIQ